MEVACAAFSFAQDSPRSFRFALITDTHLKQNDPRNAESLRLAVKDINKQKDIDFVIVSGDITDKGDRNSFLEAKRLLDRLKAPYYPIPGNHDTRYCKTATSAFDSVFVRHHFLFLHDGYLFMGFNTGQGNGINRGKVSQKELEWIKEKLRKKPINQPVIAITHFPILSVLVDDSASIVNTLLKYNVQAILNGHYHCNRKFDYTDHVPGILTRSLQENETGTRGYSIIEISNQLRVFDKDPIVATPSLWVTSPLYKKEKQ
jgi:Predicted phosphohydrolases